MGALRNTESLGEMPLFSGLAGAEMLSVQAMLHHKVYPAGTNIMSMEQPGEAVYMIESGTVKVHAEQSDGRDVILAVLGPGEVVGEMAIIERAVRSANVMTLEQTHMLWMTGSDFLNCLNTIPAMSVNLVRIMSRRLRLSSAQVQALAALDVYGRVARQILAFAQEYGKTAPNGAILIPLRLTQSEIADLVGASRVRVNQVLAYYKQQKYISVDRKFRINVLDHEALAQRL